MPLLSYSACLCAGWHPVAWVLLSLVAIVSITFAMQSEEELLSTQASLELNPNPLSAGNNADRLYQFWDQLRTTLAEPFVDFNSGMLQ
jgi:hypothetical protein